MNTSGMNTSEATYRYPGSRPFQDTPVDRKLFRGRSEEAHELLHLLLAERLVVLFANSGLGKSSLINAGVLEPLRQRDYFPMTVRVNDPENGPLYTVYKDVEEAIQHAGIELQTLAGGRLEREYGVGCQGRLDNLGELSETCFRQRVPLWLFFKESEFWRGDVLCDPVLVMDQFEELFTLHTPAQRETFVEELAHLVRDRLDAAAGGAGLRGPSLKILLSLREDWLGSLEELVPKIPSILSSRFRLGPLRKDQAREAIVEPAAMDVNEIDAETFTYAPEAVDAILDFLSRRRLHGEMVASEEVSPSQLQVICHHLEEITRKPGHGPTVTLDDLGGHPDKVPGVLAGVLEKYYDEQTSKVARGLRLHAVRRLCETGLIVNGRRASTDGAILRRRFGVTARELRRLTECHLLRAVPRLDSVYYELVHDTLVEPILASRGKRRQRRNRVASVAFSALLLIGAGAGALSSYARHVMAERERILVDLRKQEAHVDHDPLGFLLQALESAHHSRCLEAPDAASCDAILTTLGDAVDTAREVGPPPGVTVAERSDPTTATAQVAGGELRAWTRASRLHVETTGGFAQEIGVPFDEIVATATAADGRRVATAAEDGTVRVWERRDGALDPLTRPWLAHSEKILAMAFDPRHERLLTSGGQGGLALWSPSGERLAHEALDDPTIRVLKVNAIAWSADGDRFAIGGKDGVVRVWDGAWHAYERHSQGVRAVAFDPTGRWLASAGDDAALRIWDLHGAGEPRRYLLPDEDNELKAVAWSPDGRWIAAGGTGKTVLRWSLDGERRVIGEHEGAVLAMAFRPDGILASGGRDGAVRLWDVDGGRELACIGDFKRYVNAVAVAADGTLVAGSYGGSVCVVPARQRAAAERHEVSQHDLTAVALSSDGRRLASGSSDGTLRLMEWDPEEGRSGAFMRLTAPIRGSWERMEALAFDAAGERVAAATTDGRLRIWTFDGTTFDGTPSLDFPTGRADGDETVALDFVDATTLASRSAAGVRRFWDVAAADGAAARDVACDRLAAFGPHAFDAARRARIADVVRDVCSLN